MDRVLKTILLITIGVALLLGGFSGGLIAGRLLPQALPTPSASPVIVAPTLSPETLTATPQDLQTLFKPFWEAWQIVHSEYVNQPVDDTQLLEGALRGMMEALGDKHSSYMDPQTYKDANAQLAGSYEGIGAFVDTSGEYLTIISPIAGSPAEKAGLQAGDEIIAVDHKDMSGLDPELVRRKVIGPAGTSVHLTVRRKGETVPLEFDIVRARIEVPSVSGKMLENGLAYVQITTFGDKTMQDLKATLKKLMAQDPKGLILDLRDNGGGYLQTAVEVVSQFQGQGVVLYEQYGDGTKKAYQALPGGLATDIPMVVLINEGTASASEITAGALQDYGRAKLVGVTSYGKDSVQNWVPLSNGEGAVRVTIARWLTPNERQIDNQGLRPDVYVPRTPEDRKAGRDPQLEAAVETLMAVLNHLPIPTSMPTPAVTATPLP